MFWFQPRTFPTTEQWQVENATGWLLRTDLVSLKFETRISFTIVVILASKPYLCKCGQLLSSFWFWLSAEYVSTEVESSRGSRSLANKVTWSELSWIYSVGSFRGLGVWNRSSSHLEAIVLCHICFGNFRKSDYYYYAAEAFIQVQGHNFYPHNIEFWISDDWWKLKYMYIFLNESQCYLGIISVFIRTFMMKTF